MTCHCLGEQRSLTSRVQPWLKICRTCLLSIKVTDTVGHLILNNCSESLIKFPMICDKNRILSHHTYKEGQHISEHINHPSMGHHKTLLLTEEDSSQSQPIKFNHHNSVRHCSGIPENSPTQGVCLSAGLLWCLLTQEAYPEASPTPRQPSCKRPSPPRGILYPPLLSELCQ